MARNVPFEDGNARWQSLLQNLSRREADAVLSSGPPFWRGLRRNFAGIFNREETTLLRQILSAQGKTQLGLR